VRKCDFEKKKVSKLSDYQEKHFLWSTHKVTQHSHNVESTRSEVRVSAKQHQC